MKTTRRSFLGTAALGATGFVTLVSGASAADDKGQPGEGGFGRQVQQLQPGANLAYHDPKIVGEMPDFCIASARRVRVNSPCIRPTR